MKMRKLTLVILGTAGSFMLHAQRAGIPAPPQDFTELKAYLNLTDSQVTSLGDLNKAQREAGRAVSEELRAKHQAMNTAMRSGSTDSATLNSTAQAIQAGEQKMQAIHQQHQAQAVAVLTRAQQAELKTLTDAAALAQNIHQASMLGLIAPLPGQRGGPGGGMQFRHGTGGRGGPPPSEPRL